MQRQGLDAAILRKMGIPVGETPGMVSWNHFLKLRREATEEVHIGLVGKYDLQDAYKSINESLSHAATYHHRKVVITFINSELSDSSELSENQENPEFLRLIKKQDGLVICPGFGTRGIEGKILAAQYARENDIPCFGICLGMQMMVIEFARHVLGMSDAHSREMDEHTEHNVIDLMESQKNLANLGGTMRLGAYDCELIEGSRVAKIYGKQFIRERHRHRYEFNNKYRQELQDAGLVIAGTLPDDSLVEIVEVKDHPWFVASQFHPELKSRPNNPHPLFRDFVTAALEVK
jgi:CTP synthase